MYTRTQIRELLEELTLHPRDEQVALVGLALLEIADALRQEGDDDTVTSLLFSTKEAIANTNP